MASLMEIAKERWHEICLGPSWVIIWKEGRSWRSKPMWPINVNEKGFDRDHPKFDSDDLKLAEEIFEKDPLAVVLNCHSCDRFLDDTSVAGIAASIRWYYHLSDKNPSRDSDAMKQYLMEGV